MKRPVLLLALLSTLVLAACEEDAAEKPPVVAQLPPVVTDCSTCHELGELAAELSNERGGLREWVGSMGQGLVRRDPAIPAPGVHLGFTWPGRGRHGLPGAEVEGDALREACSGCHPVGADGLGHGVRCYPPEAARTVFTGGASCGGSCHGWLTGGVTAAGFQDAGGQTPTYQGSLRPAELLAAADNAHFALWREGWRTDSQRIRIWAFNPGCGGCHNAISEPHGAVAGCLDCHDLGGMGGEQHGRHVELITNHADRIDPGRPDPSPCAYCHRQGDLSGVRSRAACYNCHLGGHQPLDGEGKAHFWNIE